MSATVVFRISRGAGYGRHAAPPSAYGPSDVHRLLPVPPTGIPEAQQDESADMLVEEVDSADQDEVVAAGGVGTGDRPSGDDSTKTTGFWARLRLLPKVA